jgi:hypothetical protein
MQEGCLAFTDYPWSEGFVDELLVPGRRSSIGFLYALIVPFDGGFL